jgi:hypothetical protein
VHRVQKLISSWFAKIKAYRPSKITVLALGLYIAFTAVVTFPYVLHPGTTFIGPMGGDVSASISKYETLHVQGANPFTTEHWTEISSPVGVPGNLGIDRVSFLSVLFLWLGTLTIGSVATHGLESVSGYLLTAVLAFFFVRKVSKSEWAGLVAGFIFGFSPHMLSIARAAPTYTHMWLFILPMWAFWSLCTKGPSHKGVALAALSVVPAIFWTPYFGLHALIVASACAIVTLGVWWFKKYNRLHILASVACIATVWLLSLGAFWYIGTHSPSTQVPERTMAEIYEQAAHPLMYVAPGNFSLWGENLNEWLEKTVATARGTSLYVGLSTLVLSVIAVVYVTKHRNDRKAFFPRPGLPIAVWMAAAVVVMTFLFSLPPTVHIAGMDIPTPNQLVIDAVPALRAAQRFVMPLMGALAVLAGVGALVVVKQMRPNLRIITAAGILLVITLDLWALPPQSATTVPKFPSLAVLSEQPRGVAAHYQAGAIQGPIGQYPCTMQNQHKKPLINDCVLGRPDFSINTAPPHINDIQVLPICNQIPKLRAVGVRYIIADRQQHAIFKCLEQQQVKRIAQDWAYGVYDLSR